jgi:hypothetical protein
MMQVKPIKDNFVADSTGIDVRQLSDEALGGFILSGLSMVANLLVAWVMQKPTGIRI